MTFANSTDIADRLGRDLNESESRIVTARLGDAELLIKTRIPDLSAKVTAGTIDSDLVVGTLMVTGPRQTATTAMRLTNG